jgi:hypothetical protein
MSLQQLPQLQSLRGGLYRIKSPASDEHDVMTENDGDGGLMRETAYREKGCLPPFEELPWAEDYLTG